MLDNKIGPPKIVGTNICIGQDTFQQIRIAYLICHTFQSCAISHKPSLLAQMTLVRSSYDVLYMRYTNCALAVICLHIHPTKSSESTKECSSIAKTNKETPHNHSHSSHKPVKRRDKTTSSLSRLQTLPFGVLQKVIELF